MISITILLVFRSTIFEVDSPETEELLNLLTVCGELDPLWLAAC
jgi:hypothetical protein